MYHVIAFVQSGAATCSKGFVKCVLRVPQASTASGMLPRQGRGAFRITYYKTCLTSCCPRLKMCLYMFIALKIWEELCFYFQLNLEKYWWFLALLAHEIRSCKRRRRRRPRSSRRDRGGWLWRRLRGWREAARRRSLLTSVASRRGFWGRLGRRKRTGPGYRGWRAAGIPGNNIHNHN